MKNTLHKLIVVYIVFSLNGCVPIKYYDAEPGIHSATMSFSIAGGIHNTMPAIYFQSNTKSCESLQIPEQAIEIRQPNEIPKNTLSVDSGSPIVLSILFDDIPYVDSIEINRLEGNKINHTPSREIKLGNCEQKISFMPQANQHYEVYMGMSRGACFLRVVKTEYNATKKAIEFKRVELVKNDSC